MNSPLLLAALALAALVAAQPTTSAPPATQQPPFVLPPNWMMNGDEIIANANFNFTSVQNFANRTVRFLQSSLARFSADFLSARAYLANATMLYTDNNASFYTNELIVQNGTSFLNGTFLFGTNATVYNGSALVFSAPNNRTQNLLPNMFVVNGTLHLNGSMILDAPLDANVTHVVLDQLQCSNSSHIFLMLPMNVTAINITAGNGTLPINSTLPSNVTEQAHLLPIIVNRNATLSGDLILVLRNETVFPVGYKLPILQFANGTLGANATYNATLNMLLNSTLFTNTSLANTTNKLFNFASNEFPNNITSQFLNIRVLRLANLSFWSWYNLTANVTVGNNITANNMTAANRTDLPFNITQYAPLDANWTVQFNNSQVWLVYQPQNASVTPMPTATSSIQQTTTAIPQTTTSLQPTTTSLQQTTTSQQATTTQQQPPPTTSALGTTTRTGTTSPVGNVTLPPGWTMANGEIQVSGISFINQTRTFEQVLRLGGATVVFNAAVNATNRVIVVANGAVLIVAQSTQVVLQQLELQSGQTTIAGPVIVQQAVTVEQNTTLYLTQSSIASQQGDEPVSYINEPPMMMGVNTSSNNMTQPPAQNVTYENSRAFFDVRGQSLTVRGTLQLDLSAGELVRCRDLVFENASQLVLVIDDYAKNKTAIVCNGKAAFAGELVVRFRATFPNSTFVDGEKILVARFANATGQFSSFRFEQAIWYAEGSWKLAYEADSVYLVWQEKNVVSAANAIGSSVQIALVALLCAFWRL